MGMPAPQTEWTAEMARALPDDGRRHEVLDGELWVSPAPSWHHQGVVKALTLRLAPYVAQHRLGWLRFSPADIEFSPRHLVQPDLFVVPDTGAGPPSAWRDVRHLSLVVEVLSPATARSDRMRKRAIYQGQRIPEYWIVDPEALLIERWKPDDNRPEVIADRLTWQAKPEIPGLEIDVPALFADALD